MKNILIPILAMLILFTSCGGHHKKVLIYGSSKINVDDKNIKVGSGTTHNEQEADFSGASVQLSVETPAGKQQFDLTEDGLYILNLKNDTVVGSYQHVGSSSVNKITQEQLKQKIDSLQRLVMGQNISAANRNYFIPPNKITRITAELTAKVFGPYTTIPSSFDAGTVPEVYKFYTNKEEKEIIDNLIPMIK